MKIKNYIYILILNLFFNSAFAKEAEKKLTLDDCLSITLKQNRTLQVIKINTELAELNLEKTNAVCLPEINTSAGYTYSELLSANPNQYNNDSYTARISLVQLIYNRRTSVFFKQTKINIQSEEENLKEEINAILLKVKEDFYNLLRLKKVVELRKQAVTAMQEHLKTADTLYKKGLSIETDLLRAEIEVSNAEKNLLTANNQKNLAYKNLCLTLGLSMETNLEIEEYSKEIIPIIEDLNFLQKKALEERPLLKKFKENFLSSQESIALAKADLWPKVSMSANYNMTGTTFFPNDDDWNVGLNVSFNIFDGGLKRINIKEAEYKNEQEKINFFQFEEALKVEIESIYTKLKESYEFINITQKIVVTAEKNFILIQKKYEKGLVPNTILLDAYIQYLEAKNNKIYADYDCRVTLARLEKAVGCPIGNSR